MYSAGLEIHIKQDDATSLLAIIAIHDRHAEISFGGCRFLPYSSPQLAIDDAIRLASAMKQKSLICGMNYGGAKAVLMRTKTLENREIYFKNFGRFVNELGGRFVTGCDSGVTGEDMRAASSVCKYITACDVNDNLSDLTAVGIKCAMEVIVRTHLGKMSISNVHVAIQGVGKVGYALAKQLKLSGAKLTITDLDATRAGRIARELGADYVPPEDIYDVDCDIFAPCALGGILNEKTTNRIKAFLICGAANNQLQSKEISNALFNKKIMYLPDFLCNSGGFIYAVENYFGGNEITAREKIIKNMTQRVSEVYELSLKMNSPMEEAAQGIIS
jgi:leucine dehydrogenase